jgi:hypothetical protein
LLVLTGELLLIPFIGSKELKFPGIPDIKFVGKNIPNLDNEFFYLKKAGQEIFSFRASTDLKGRRRMSVDPSKENFLIVPGSSVAFGIGVNDDESYPYFLSKELKRFNVYNYAVTSTGISTLLQQLEDRELYSDIVGTRGIVLYILARSNIFRFINALSSTYLFDFKRNYYLNENGELVKGGFIEEELPARYYLFRFLSRSKILRLLKLNIPLRLTKNHFLLTCEAMKVAKQRVHNIWNKGKFVVDLSYMSFKGKEKFNQKMIKECFVPNNIHFIDVSKEAKSLDAGVRGKLFIKNDVHYSKDGNEFAAKIVAPKIKKIFNKDLK